MRAIKDNEIISNTEESDDENNKEEGQ